MGNDVIDSLFLWWINYRLFEMIFKMTIFCFLSSDEGPEAPRSHDVL